MAVTAWKSWLPKEQTLFPEIDYLGKLWENHDNEINNL
jgi:hypothetical protein